MFVYSLSWTEVALIILIIKLPLELSYPMAFQYKKDCKRARQLYTHMQC
jgi:hypothetical protein